MKQNNDNLLLTDIPNTNTDEMTKMENAFPLK